MESNNYGIYKLTGKYVTTYHFFKIEEYSREKLENESFEFIKYAATYKEAKKETPDAHMNKN